MKHDVSIMGPSAVCACGLSALCESMDDAFAWKDRHLSDSGQALACDITDDQLRAEWARRHNKKPEQDLCWSCGRTRMPTFAELASQATRDELLFELERRGVNTLLDELAAERDKWKRRAEAAEANADKWNGYAKAMIDANERGPGIATAPPTDEQWFDPIDCLADDA